MSILHRLWSREVATSDSDPPLAQRLKELTDTDAPGTRESDADEPVASGQTVPSSAAALESASKTPAKAEALMTAEPSGPEPPAAASATPPPEAQKTGSGAVEVSSHPTEQGRERQEAEMDNVNPVVAAKSEKAEDEPVVDTSSSPAPKGPGRQFVDRFHAAVDRAGGSGGKGTAPIWEPPSGLQSIQKQFEDDFQKRMDGALAEFERRLSSQALVDDVAGQIEQRIRLVADGIFKEVKGQAWTMHSAVAGELRSFRDQFGKEIEERVGMLDRAAQQALQLKEKLETTLPKAEGALQSLSASGQEASAKLQGVSKESEERLRLFQQDVLQEIDSQKEALQTLAQTLRQDGLQLQEQMERFRAEAGGAGEVLGRTTDESLEKLNAAAGEASARFRQDVSEEIDSQKEALQTLAQGLRQEGQQLQEQMEKFRAEAGGAFEALGRATDQSLEKLNTAADEASARAREGIENLEAEVERRVLSGGLVEKATERLGKATQELVEPSLERIRMASQEADSAAESLAGTGQRVAEQVEEARKQIEARLDSLLVEQLSQVEGAMSGFQRTASEELGSVVERVVAQSTIELDERLHGLFQDLFVTTSKQINTAARATLSNMQEGLKEAFNPPAADPAPEPTDRSGTE